MMVQVIRCHSYIAGMWSTLTPGDTLPVTPFPYRATTVVTLTQPFFQPVEETLSSGLKIL